MSQIPNYPNLWLEILPKISIFMQYFVTNYIMIYCVIVLIMYFFSAGWDDHCILYVYVLYVATNVDSNVLVLNDGKLIYNYNNDADIMPLLTCFIRIAISVITISVQILLTWQNLSLLSTHYWWYIPLNIVY